MQALRCVQYRVPNADGLSPSSFVLSLALRYGLVGCAAFHHLLINSEEVDDELEILAAMDAWGDVVEDHVRWEVRLRMPFACSEAIPEMVGRLSVEALRAHLPLYRRLYPLSNALQVIAAKFTTDHRPSIERSWNPCERKRQREAFRHLAADSVYFAETFFARRQAEMDEVPEIALIGE